MKKMFKTSLAVAMSVCMAAALTACGGSGSASSSAPADSGAAAETTESADTGAKIKIGGSGPLTGPAAVYGQAVKNAAEIAVEEVNAKGGSTPKADFSSNSICRTTRMIPRRQSLLTAF